MTRVTEFKALVEEILSDMVGDEHRDRWVPHGFTVVATEAEMAPSYFPENAEHVEVKARIEAPVIFSVKDGHAALPARRDNLDRLRAWIEKELRDRVTRLEISDWDASPDGDPKVKRDQIWTVDAVIRER